MWPGQITDNIKNPLQYIYCRGKGGIMLKRLFFFLVDGAVDFWKLANLGLYKQSLLFGIFVASLAAALVNPAAAWLLALAPIAFVQNMFFTLVSRSRNSQDPDYHRYCAWGSNGVWFVCQVMIVKNIWGAIHAGQWWYALAAGVVYSLATTEGSVLMMKKLIRDESGKRRVGANEKINKLESRINFLESFIANEFSDSYNNFVGDQVYNFGKENTKGGE